MLSFKNNKDVSEGKENAHNNIIGKEANFIFVYNINIIDNSTWEEKDVRGRYINIKSIVYTFVAT